jgi:hypothetical protein
MKPRYGSNTNRIGENGRLFAGTSHPPEWNWKPRTARARREAEAFREAYEEMKAASDARRDLLCRVADILGIED